MKLSLLMAALLPVAIFAQQGNENTGNNPYPNTFSSGSADVHKFDNKSRFFNDWSLSVGGGAAFLAHGDVTSFYGNKVNWGGDFYVSLDKQITHAFGMSLQYQMGKTNQKAMLPGAAGAFAGVATADTKYHMVMLLGDVNFSNLMRRVDNHSPYRWALHGYAGIGFSGYDTYLTDHGYALDQPHRPAIAIHQVLGIASFQYEGGVGLRYKVSKSIDIEGRVMYIWTGDDEFDGGGWTETTGVAALDYNMINKSHTDRVATANLGISFKLGKHISALEWHDPLQEVYNKLYILDNKSQDIQVCTKGDVDNDGVCDDWDRQLNTPAGARVDGAGVALDMDLDGVIDLYDKCVTVPGPVENNGCPVSTSK